MERITLLVGRINLKMEQMHVNQSKDGFVAKDVHVSPDHAVGHATAGH